VTNQFFTSGERKMLDIAIDAIADAIVCTLVTEVNDPNVRRAALIKAAARFGMTCHDPTSDLEATARELGIDLAQSA
jgi:hypothetical protein